MCGEKTLDAFHEVLTLVFRTRYNGWGFLTSSTMVNE